ncbi:MAG: hypothetical protein KAT65_21795, partial [Methanophagales archaeon]|nr:hypothetical protein [Methanophagales archaeon]
RSRKHKRFAFIYPLSYFVFLLFLEHGQSILTNYNINQKELHPSFLFINFAVLYSRYIGFYCWWLCPLSMREGNDRGGR